MMSFLGTCSFLCELRRKLGLGDDALLLSSFANPSVWAKFAINLDVFGEPLLVKTYFR
jgi:hypothetical protein